MPQECYTIFGPPGTGKTTRLGRGIAHYMWRGYRADEIFFLSFTKATAREAVERFDHPVQVGTIHSLAYHGLDIEGTGVVQFSDLRRFMSAMGLTFRGVTPEAFTDVSEGDDLLDAYQVARAKCVEPGTYYEQLTSPSFSLTRLEWFCTSYDAFKEKSFKIDFSDMLTLYEQHLVSNPREIKVLIIDEAQDLSMAQWRVVRRLVPGAEIVVFAGDPDQAIYEWSGARSQGMMEASADFDAKVEVLPRTFRLPSVIRDFSLDIASMLSETYDKDFEAKKQGGEVELVPDPIDLLDEDREVLYLHRTNRLRRKFENEYLIPRRVPFVTLGRKSLWEHPVASQMRYPKSLAKLSSETRRGVNLTAEQARQVALSGDAERMMQTFKMSYEEADYLNSVDLDETPRAKSGTIHSSKGGEAPVVYVDGGASKRIESAYMKEPDPEIRCWYVAATRASEELHIVPGSKYNVMPWGELIRGLRAK